MKKPFIIGIFVLTLVLTAWVAYYYLDSVTSDVQLNREVLPLPESTVESQTQQSQDVDAIFSNTAPSLEAQEQQESSSQPPVMSISPVSPSGTKPKAEIAEIPKSIKVEDKKATRKVKFTDKDTPFKRFFLEKAKAEKSKSPEKRETTESLVTQLSAKSSGLQGVAEVAEKEPPLPNVSLYGIVIGGSKGGKTAMTNFGWVTEGTKIQGKYTVRKITSDSIEVETVGIIQISRKPTVETQLEEMPSSPEFADEYDLTQKEQLW
ncbi:MAG: hypothetical protein DDT19_00034 [Syntrophomonadaceae bacterium]|nr:hypothetical protein [Bacillota bacterium]